MHTPFIPSYIIDTLSISQAKKKIRPTLERINYNPETNSFASTDSYRLTDFTPNKDYLEKQRPFPDYKIFIPTFDTAHERYKAIKLNDLINEFSVIKATKKAKMKINQSNILLYRNDDTIEKAMTIPSTLLSFLNGTSVDANFLHEFIVSLKGINKDFSNCNIEIIQIDTLKPIAFRIIVPEGTLTHIIMPVRSDF